MKALLLAAGFGTRLRPLTDVIPKCLVAIKGEPLLGIWLENLAKAGIGPFLVNTHYLAEKVENFIATSGYKEQATLVYEKELKGTAGTLVTNLGFFDDTDGLLIHADNYCEADFIAFREAHEQRPAECLLTMMTFRTDTPSSCGIVKLDKRGVVISFHEKIANPPGNLANGAVYILSKEFIKLVGDQYRSAIEFSTDVLPHFEGRIYSYETKATFKDIGTPEAYASVQ